MRKRSVIERVGILGVGRMGLPIARRLLDARHDVTAFDTDTAALRRARAAGLRTTDSARDLVRATSILITILPGPGELRSALIGEQRLLDELQPGSCWLDLTSNDPRVAVEVAGEASARAVESVGAPMAGGPRAAESGSLGFFVGGDPAVVERIMPVLVALGSGDDIRVLGADVGAGFTAKLMANTLWFGQAVAVTEMLLVGKAAGLDLRTLADALEGSAGGSTFITRHLNALLAGDYLETFGIDRVVEELETVSSLADEFDVPHELTALVTRLHREALGEFGPVEGELLAAKLLERRGRTLLRA